MTDTDVRLWRRVHMDLVRYAGCVGPLSEPRTVTRVPTRPRTPSERLRGLFRRRLRRRFLRLFQLLLVHRFRRAGLGRPDGGRTARLRPAHRGGPGARRLPAARSRGPHMGTTGGPRRQ
ncbi:putative leader peptide [Streptomyces sp. adm13(2018)]|uniref:putative leader peptide n=1 Tax=Streptomyces sp. adm13(2018) TaxID=2479007 RepID=UPI002905C47F|nr:putative leader peptide [Streptomyces sp. adm13(2018)]